MDQTQQYVGIDLHRRRSVIVRRTEAGETLDTVRIDNDAVALAREVTKAGSHPEVVVEATLGWYWAADVVAECGGNVHLAHPLGNDWGHRRVIPEGAPLVKTASARRADSFSRSEASR